MNKVMPAYKIDTAQKPNQLILGCLMKGSFIEPQCPYVMNLMILDANLCIYDSISQRIYGNVFSVPSKPVPE